MYLPYDVIIWSQLIYQGIINAEVSNASLA